MDTRFRTSYDKEVARGLTRVDWVEMASHDSRLDIAPENVLETAVGSRRIARAQETIVSFRSVLLVSTRVEM